MKTASNKKPAVTSPKVADPSSSPAKDSTVAAKTPEEEDDYEFDWVDAPPVCVRFFWPLLYCCRRHPSQKAAYLKRKRALEAKYLAAEAAKLAKETDEPTAMPGGGSGATPRLDTIEDDIRSDLAPPQTLPFCIGGAITRASAVSYAANFVFLGFCTYYLMLFSILQDGAGLSSFMTAWLVGEAVGLGVYKPAFTALRVLLSYVVWPLNARYVAWVPVLGPRIVRLGARLPSSGATADSLAGRLENLTLVRAAGMASLLSPEAALVAYGVSAAVSATVRGFAGFMRGAGGRNNEAGEREAAGRRRRAAQLRRRISGTPEAERKELLLKLYILQRLRSRPGTQGQEPVA